MNLYHLSFDDLCNDFVIKDLVKTRYYEQKESEGNIWIEEVLEKYRPEGAPSREKVLFTFDKIGMCGFFKDQRYDNQTAYYYSVCLKNTWRSPMYLIRVIQLLGKNSNKLESVALEYWKPTKDWKIFEYFGYEMTILEKLKKPTIEDIMISGAQYDLDIELAESTYL